MAKTDKSQQEIRKRTRILKVLLQDISETDSDTMERGNSSGEDDDVRCDTGYFTLQAKTEIQIETLVNKSIVYTVWKGRALLMLNGCEYVLEKGGMALVQAGDEHSIRNLREHKKLVMRYYIVDDH